MIGAGRQRGFGLCVPVELLAESDSGHGDGSKDAGSASPAPNAEFRCDSIERSTGAIRSPGKRVWLRRSLIPKNGLSK